jgi:ectoine hydroxylase-related dioxygenase (phytanoyl-CoA dioxygenase family)
MAVIAHALPPRASLNTDLDRFEECGYVVIEDAFDREHITELNRCLVGDLNELDGVLHRALDCHLTDVEGVRRLSHELDHDKARFEALPRDVQQLLKGEFPFAVRHRDEFKLMCRSGRLIDAISELLGEDHPRMHYPPMMRFKLPGHAQSAVPLHQDHVYFPHLDQFVVTWIPFCDISDDCGGICVLEGSHRLGKLEHEHAVLWGNYLEGPFAQFECKHVAIPMGAAIAFHPQLIHQSYPGTPQRLRLSVDGRWFRGSANPKARYFDTKAQSVIDVF